MEKTSRKYQERMQNRRKTDHSVGGGSKINDKEDEQTRANELQKADNAPEGRYRHKCNPSKVYAITNNGVGDPRAYERARVIQKTGFGSILGICNWKSIPSYFIKWVAENFEPESMQIRLNKTDVLKLTDADVERVYGLPRRGKHIDLSKCKKSSIKKLRSEIGLEGEYSDMVAVSEIEHALTNLDNAVAWSKAVIIYILGCLLCPTNNPNISLKYAQVLEDFETLSNYNWCKHVLEHMGEGIPQKGFKNPKADFHFLLINYMDRMGKESPLLKGVTKGPTLYGRDIKTLMETLHKINEIVGLERGITCGVTKMLQDELSQASCTVLMFDADTCPIQKAPEYATYCKGQVEIYSNCLKTLKRRMEDEGEETEQHEETDGSEGEPIRKRKRRQSYATVVKKKRNVIRRNSENPVPDESSDGIQLNANTDTDPEQNEPIEVPIEFDMVSLPELPVMTKTITEQNTKQNEPVEASQKCDVVLPEEPPTKIKIEDIEEPVFSTQYLGAKHATEFAVTPAPVEESDVMMNEVEISGGEENEQSLDDVITIACVLGTAQ